MIENWLNAIDNGKMIGIVLVDFKKAFKLVDHKILLSKLKIYENTMTINDSNNLRKVYFFIS